MNLTAAIAAVRNLILERSGQNSLVDDAELTTIISMANRAVWKIAVKRSPHLWEELSADLQTVGGALAYSAIVAAPAEVHKVQYLEIKVGSDWQTIWPMDAGERFQAEGIRAPVGPATAAKWYVRGAALVFAPAPPAELTARATFIRVPPDLTANDALLGGRCGVHHDAVVLKAAMLAYSKDEEQATPYDDDYSEATALLLRDLAEEQGQQTRRISRRGIF